MFVNREEGTCPECDGTLEIVDADDATLTASCTECGEIADYESDAFDGSCMDHFVPFHLQKMIEAEESRQVIDPDDLWNRFLLAYSTKDWESVLNHAHALLQWLNVEGFPPHLTTGSTTGHLTCQLDEFWNRAVARAACMVALDRAEAEVDRAAH